MYMVPVVVMRASPMTSSTCHNSCPIDAISSFSLFRILIRTSKCRLGPAFPKAVRQARASAASLLDEDEVIAQIIASTIFLTVGDCSAPLAISAEIVG
jgi:hypothetical protein